MIRINLIPTKRRKKSKPMPMYLIGMVASLLGGLVIFFAVSMYMNSKLDELDARKKTNEQKIKELNKKIKEVKDFEALNKKFIDRKKVIEDLTKNQSLPVRVLDEISLKLTEGVWLVSVNIANNRVSISGVGFSNSDIVNYVQSMKKSELFTSVVLHGTVKQAGSGGVGVDTFSFNISFQIKA
ncbi:PilN domain-containing protein [Nitrospirota bacterium]